VNITPIPFIDGTADFCEVVFDHVFVPDELVLGEIGQGWSQNTSELAYERGGPDRWLSSYLLVEELLRRETSADPGGPTNDDLLDLLGEAIANYWVLHHLSLSVARSIGGAASIEASLVKEMGTRFEQDVLGGASRSSTSSRRTGSLASRTAVGDGDAPPPSFDPPAAPARSCARWPPRDCNRPAASDERPDRQRGRPRRRPPGRDGGATPRGVEHLRRGRAAETDGWCAPVWGALAEAGFPWISVAEDAGERVGHWPTPWRCCAASATLRPSGRRDRRAHRLAGGCRRLRDPRRTDDGGPGPRCTHAREARTRHRQATLAWARASTCSPSWRDLTGR
jgi:hypothetical protein